jgi:hypothetical protein
MKFLPNVGGVFLSISLSLLIVSAPVGFADHESSHSGIDVDYLQTCLKEENASLDVLVLMDSSRSLRDTKPGEKDHPTEGNDPQGKRGPILESSLQLLQELAQESGNSFKLNLRNFGNNEGKDLKDLQDKWIDWTSVTPEDAEPTIDAFVRNALFDDSPGTDWASGISTARVEFAKRFAEAEAKGEKSCSILFWITDGVPSNPSVDENRICSSNSDASIDWFRERNILVLGGLLIPGKGDWSKFKPIVTGDKGCGRTEDSWTKGSVVEANDINSLAWQFVSLIANIKNLINLGAENGSINVDRGTSRIEIYIKGVPDNWQVKGPDGSVVCVAGKRDQQCDFSRDPKIGITTITIKPTNPVKAEGLWTVEPNAGVEIKAYGGLAAEPNPVRLTVDPPTLNSHPEGKEATFTASLVNSDGTPFDITGFKSIEICASVESTGQNICKSGSATARLGVFPSLNDSSVKFKAVVTSSRGENREYPVIAVIKVSVQRSGEFASLVCDSGREGDVCAIPTLSNKSDKQSVALNILRPTDPSASGGKIYLKSFDIIRDDLVRDFNFVLTDENQRNVTWGDAGAQYSPGDTLNLEVSTEIGGESVIEGVIKYVVVVDGKEVVRELKFEFGMEAKKNWLALISMLLLAYLLTVGIPYAFLLWSARRNAVLAPPGNEFSYLSVPVAVSQAGKIIISDSAEGADLVSHKNLTKIELENRSKSTTVSLAEIATTPPKWNPFVQSSVHVRVPNHHILTTYSHGILESEKAIFNPNLVDDAILYFPDETNFAPESVSEVIANDDPFASSSYEENIQQELRQRTGGLSGEALFIVSSSGNRRKALQELKIKVQSLGEGTNILDQIMAERERFLKETLEAEAASKIAAQESESSKKSKKKEVKKDAVIDETETESETEADLFDDESQSRSKKKSTNLWDDDEFPDTDKKSDMWD